MSDLLTIIGIMAIPSVIIALGLVYDFVLNDSKGIKELIREWKRGK